MTYGQWIIKQGYIYQKKHRIQLDYYEKWKPLVTSLLEKEHRI
jgi:hypothetical protein